MIYIIKMKNKTNIVQNVLFTISLAKVLFSCSIFLSLVVWGWYSWSMAWKTGLVGIGGVIAMIILYVLVERLSVNEIKEEEKKYVVAESY